MKTTIIQLILSLVFMNYIKAQDKPVKYEVNQNGYSFSTRPEWDNAVKMSRMDHRSEIDSVFYDEYFNRGIRRSNTILVTGDRPRFAIMKNVKPEKPDPDLIKMGEGMIRIKIDKREKYLESMGSGNSCRPVRYGH